MIFCLDAVPLYIFHICFERNGSLQIPMKHLQRLEECLIIFRSACGWVLLLEFYGWLEGSEEEATGFLCYGFAGLKLSKLKSS